MAGVLVISARRLKHLMENVRRGRWLHQFDTYLSRSVEFYGELISFGRFVL